MYWSSGLDNKHGQALKPNNTKDYFDALEELNNLQQFKAKNVYGADESCFMIEMGTKQHVIGMKGKKMQHVIGMKGKKMQHVQWDGSRESVTLLVTICAVGTVPMKPTVIFTSKNHLKC
jgi:hypothetical protein